MLEIAPMDPEQVEEGPIAVEDPVVFAVTDGEDVGVDEALEAFGARAAALIGLVPLVHVGDGGEPFGDPAAIVTQRNHVALAIAVLAGRVADPARHGERTLRPNAGCPGRVEDRAVVGVDRFASSGIGRLADVLAGVRRPGRLSLIGDAVSIGHEHELVERVDERAVPRFTCRECFADPVGLTDVVGERGRTNETAVAVEDRRFVHADAQSAAGLGEPLGFHRGDASARRIAERIMAVSSRRSSGTTRSIERPMISSALQP